MDGRPISLSFVLWRALAVASLGLLLMTPAQASAIHSNAHWKLRTETSLGPQWQRFLAGGPSLWATTRAPAFPSGLVLATSNGLPVETPFVDYLLWRRALDPTRFDHYHPNVGPELAQLTSSTAATSSNLSAESLTAPPTTNPQPQTVVPEPDAILVGLLLATAGLGWHWRGRLNREQTLSSP